MEDALQAPRLEDAIDSGVSSCFRRVETLQRMHVLPSYIGHVSDGILSALNAQILRYSKVYGGVVLSYSKPIVLGTQGLIMDEQPHIHFSVKVSMYVFRPRVNAILRGTVNSISTAHVGCLVYNCFNASVLARLGGHNARTTSGLFSKQLQVGRQIWFRVTRLDTTTEVLFMQGEYVGMVGERGEEVGMVGERGEEVGMVGKGDGTLADTEMYQSPIRAAIKDDTVVRKASKKKKVTVENELEVLTLFEEEGVRKDHTKEGIELDDTELKKSVMKKCKSNGDRMMSVEQLEQPRLEDSEIDKGNTKKRKRKVEESDLPSKKRKLAS